MNSPETSTAPDPWLPPDGVLLHIGPHKTGTTALQQSLFGSGADLSASNVSLAPNRLQRRAAAAVTGHFLGGRPGQTPGIEAWEKLAGKAAAKPGGKFVISCEIFANAESDQIRRILADLGPERLRVLITVRPLEKILPSTWQQGVKNGATTPYVPWLNRILEGPGAERQGLTARKFWHRHDHAALARRWADVVGSSNVRVLVVDTSNPGQLFRDVEDLLGVPEGTVKAAERSNRSLSAMEIEAVRQAYRLLNPEMTKLRGHRWIARGAVIDLLEGRVPGPREAGIVTPAWAVGKAREFGAGIVARLIESDIEVIGDPGLLLPRKPPASPDTQELPQQVDTEILAHLMRGLYRAAAADVTDAETERKPEPGGATQPAVAEGGLPTGLGRLIRGSRLGRNH